MKVRKVRKLHVCQDSGSVSSTTSPSSTAKIKSYLRALSDRKPPLVRLLTVASVVGLNPCGLQKRTMLRGFGITDRVGSRFGVLRGADIGED